MDTLPQLTGVRVEIEGDQLTLAATDRYRLAVRTLSWKPQDEALSATALVMLAEIWDILPEHGQTVAPIILSAILLLELLGPIAVQVALRFAGELAPAATEPGKELP